MSLGTKHRLKETADLCKQHLREKHRDQGALVEESIAEFESKERNHTRWSMQFADRRRPESEMFQRIDSGVRMIVARFACVERGSLGSDRGGGYYFSVFARHLNECLLLPWRHKNGLGERDAIPASVVKNGALPDEAIRL